MKKRIFLFLLIVVSIFAINFCSASPAPWGIAINPSIDACALHNLTDDDKNTEWYNETISQGWKFYYPNEESMIETEYGTCYFPDKSYSFSCCNELGFSQGEGDDVLNGGFFIKYWQYWCL